MHLGLIGGIGPASTVVYYQKLTAAMRAAGKPLELTIVNADANVLVKNNLADDRAAQAQVYAGLIDRLKAAGADFAAITSLGGHFCIHETVPLSALPLVSGVTPLDAYFAANRIATVGLLGTAVVMRTQLYGQLAQTCAIAPKDIDAVGQNYLDMALSGACTDDQRTAFFAQGKELIQGGADAVVLAGTDLNLAFDGREVGYPVIDALDIHIDLLVRLCTGQADLKDHAMGKTT
ncbi:aspartate/glutamate racemase family protein [Sulfitobacter donghicola]|uniref:Aspartate racemase n=1 Tax=Sulfitobacter donghicola DSW-25 = KCTC 12864 = JCM 14565 TaxID=1300350 RepID=A0A073IIM4_9RHOB|nr:aspartate/glutamate racemase family protein [Sulfitobacter donghicola]KEJ89371.1 aspartate racemase [Sulfitobacter donghicola DSW-25 = KCTC 12864 = JCM 14565]KIN69185.1 putative aspartate racemase [Sulfitobacter donghicola DSW-25 = KCTC 12864 = JCM 14565]